MRHSTLSYAFAAVAVGGVFAVSVAARGPQDHQHPAGGRRASTYGCGEDEEPGGRRRHVDRRRQGALRKELRQLPRRRPAKATARWPRAEDQAGGPDGRGLEARLDGRRDLTRSSADGIKATGMRAYSPKLTDHQIWDVVNYLRSIGPKS